MMDPRMRQCLMFATVLVVGACSPGATTTPGTATFAGATPAPDTAAAPAAATIARTGTTPAPAPGARVADPPSVSEPTIEKTTAKASATTAPGLVDLVNTDGTPFRMSSLAGRPSLLFFGYTHCPDVCPATIGQLFSVFEARPEVQAVFISVDPERDTPEFLESWTQYFPDNFLAVTGTPGAIRRAADAYGVRYARVETSSTIGYTMSHTADVYLIDQAGRLLRSYPFGTPAAAMIEDLTSLTAG